MRGKGSRATLWMSVAFMWGCAAPVWQPVETSFPVPESFSPGPSRNDGSPAVSRWWEHFGDENLNAVVAKALAASPDVTAAIARLDQARARSAVAAAVLRPAVTASAQAGADRQPGPGGSHRGVNYRLSFEASYEVDLWKKLASRERSAFLEEEASRIDVETVYLGLAARCVDLYYLAAEQRAQLRLVTETVVSFSDTLTRVEERYRNGLVPALDLYQAQQNLSRARARRPVIETALARAEHALAAILGAYPAENLFGSLAVLPAAPAQWPAGIPSEVISFRPDVRSALARLRSADALAAAAVAERYPSFNLMAGFGQVHTSLAGGDAAGMFWNFLAGMAQPLLDGRRREAEVEGAEAVVRERIALYHQRTLLAFREVEDALAANAATERRLAHLAEWVEATENTLRLSMERYLQGLSSYLPVLTAQVLHFDARSQLLTERRQLISDRVSLARALGGTWMAEEVRRKELHGWSVRSRPPDGDPATEDGKQ